MNFWASGFLVYISPNTEATAFKWVLARGGCWGAPGSLVLFLPSLLPCVESRGKWEFVPADQSLAGDEWRARRSAAFWALCIARGGQKRICSKCQLSLSHEYGKICIKLVCSNLHKCCDTLFSLQDSKLDTNFAVIWTQGFVHKQIAISGPHYLENKLNLKAKNKQKYILKHHQAED